MATIQVFIYYDMDSNAYIAYSGDPETVGVAEIEKGIEGAIVSFERVLLSTIEEVKRLPIDYTGIRREGNTLLEFAKAKLPEIPNITGLEGIATNELNCPYLPEGRVSVEYFTLKTS